MVKRRIRSYLKLGKDIYAEIKKVRGVRRVTSVYIILGAVYHLAVYVMPQLGDAVTNAPKLNALLSWRSWIILALVILIVFIVDGAQRVQRRKLKAQGKRNCSEVARKQDHIEDLEKRASELLAGPKLTGFFQDASSSYMFSKPEPEVESEFTKIGRPLSPTGTTIAIFVRIVNENPTPTTLHNFSLTAEASGKKVLARYPEEQIKRSALDERVMPPEILEHEKRMTNLVTYLSDHSKQLTQGVGVEGYLVFNLPGFGLLDELTDGAVGVILPGGSPLCLTLGIEDAWGKYHLIKDTWGNQPRPSRRLGEPSDDPPYTVW